MALPSSRVKADMETAATGTMRSMSFSPSLHDSEIHRLKGLVERLDPKAFLVTHSINDRVAV